MAFNPEESIQALCHDFQTLIDFTSDPQQHTVRDVEAHLFSNLLKLGARLMQVFFESQAQRQSTAPLAQADGPPLRYHGKRQRSYFSVFGKIHFERAYFYRPGGPGAVPLDHQLDLPDHCYSPLLCDWASFAATERSYGASQALFEHLLQLRLPKLALERIVGEQAAQVEAFYAQKPPPKPAQEGTILVVQADGKGVPMRGPAHPSARRGKGDKRTKKKEALVTALYSIDPYRRSPAQVTAALMRQTGLEPPQARPSPQGKQVWATLSGKDTALAHLRRQAKRRAGEHVVDRVALTDGAIALQQRMQTHFPDYTLVLDIIHAVEYLWKSANALKGERDPARTAWVQAHLERLLSGQIAEVITALEAEVADGALEASARAVVETTLGYYRRNAPYMRYAVYLRRGWPIASGVVEGACGYLVKDRMEQSGMRWSQEGAQSVLDLRAVRVNGDWSAYQSYLHRQAACEDETACSREQDELRLAA